MPNVRKWGEDHIYKSLKQIDPTSWLIGDLVLHRSPCPSETATGDDDELATWTDDGDNSSYTLTKAPSLLPPATLLADSPYVRVIHERADASVVWSIGSNAVCKFRYTVEGTTAESTTLKFVQEKRPSFETPKVLHHAFGTDRNYLFLSRVPGRTLDAAWPSLNDYWRRHYVDAVVNVIIEMAEWTGHRFGGVDGKDITQYFLQPPDDCSCFSWEILQENCEELGLDCSDIVFSHCDLGPTNVIVEDEAESGKVGIIDFEAAGNVPRDWISTKCWISGGMGMSSEGDDEIWYKLELVRGLERKGFREFTTAWAKWAGRLPADA